MSLLRCDHSFVLLPCVVVVDVCIAQNAACVALFPIPVPLPGFYSTSLTQFSSCVPASACLGVDVQRVTASFSSLLLGGVEELRRVGGRLVLHINEPRVSESSLDADVVTHPHPHDQVDALFQHFFAATLGQPANGTIDNSSVGRQTCVIADCASHSQCQSHDAHSQHESCRPMCGLQAEFALLFSNTNVTPGQLVQCTPGSTALCILGLSDSPPLHMYSRIIGGVERTSASLTESYRQHIPGCGRPATRSARLSQCDRCGLCDW